jgi:hypothetical protein
LAAASWGQSARDRPTPTLTDARGKTYNPPAVNLGGEGDGLSQKSEMFPLGIMDEVYLFDAPAAGVDLRLEFPAAAWGGTGVLRFAIPASMVRTDSTTSPLEMGK